MPPRKNRTQSTGKARATTSFSALVPRNFRLPTRFNAAVGRNADGKPVWFLFDLIAFWEFICNIDERMHESLSDETYEKLSLGPIIDGLEKDWPFDKKFMANVQKSYNKALRDIKAGKTRSL